MNIFIPITGLVEHYDINKAWHSSKEVTESFDFVKHINSLPLDIRYIKLVFNVPSDKHGTVHSTEIGAFQRLNFISYENNDCGVPCEIWVD